MKAIECETALNREIERMQPQVIELIRTLCAIPAPSHHAVSYTHLMPD